MSEIHEVHSSLPLPGQDGLRMHGEKDLDDEGGPGNSFEDTRRQGADEEADSGTQVIGETSDLIDETPPLLESLARLQVTQPRPADDAGARQRRAAERYFKR